jgi:AAA+ ATPase superfamily predicted ATPase
MFLGRQRELDALQAVLKRAPALAILYGRRRVGKSALLREALKDIPHVSFQATRLTDSDNQATFKEQIARQLDMGLTFPGLSGWEHLINAIRERAAATPGLTLVLDEFPYLCESNPGLPSVLQKIRDEVTREGTPFNLILCGSRIAFMSELLAERNPLYGRQSAVMDLKPLPFRDAVQFFRDWSLEDRVRGYAVFGGMPYYLSLVDPHETLAQNIERLFLASEAAPMREEPQHLLEAELQNVGRYASILHAVAAGANKRGEIVSRIFNASETPDSISPYFERLIALRLLTPETSIDAASERTRNIRYRIADNFLAFHYRFVTPNLTALETAPPKAVYEALIARYLDEYTSGPFEEMAREYVRRYGGEVLPSAARGVGKIFAPDYDLDVAGELLDGSAVFGEAKWSVKHLGLNQVVLLQSRVAQVDYLKDAERKYLFVFSRSGFSPQLTELAGSDSLVKLVSLQQMLFGNAAIFVGG